MEAWKDPATPVIWITSACILLFILLAFILIMFRTYVRKIRQEEREKRNLLLKHQHDLLTNTIESEEKEKKRIAQNLHDDLLAQLHRVKLINNDTELSQPLSQIIQQLRDISHDLLPPFLDELPFEESINNFLHAFKKEYDISIQINSQIQQNISSSVKLQLFRILQELTINILKHSKANQIAVMWRATTNYSCLIVTDNGIGINTESTQGLGLKNIESRAKVIQANYRFRSKKNKGTSFQLLIKS